MPTGMLDKLKNITGAGLLYCKFDTANPVFKSAC